MQNLTGLNLKDHHKIPTGIIVILVLCLALSLFFNISGHMSYGAKDQKEGESVKVYMPNLTDAFGLKLIANGVREIKLQQDAMSGKYKLSFSMPGITPKDTVWVGMDKDETSFSLTVSESGDIFGVFEKSSASAGAALIDTSAMWHLKRVSNASLRILQAENSSVRMVTQPSS